jgi:predicted O-methyltransferase YrrM
MSISLRGIGEGYPAPVPVHQRTGEFDALLKLYKKRQPKRVLEIGTYEGGTLYHWLQGKPDLAVTVDDFRDGINNKHLYADWTSDGTRLEVIEGDSHDPLIIKRIGELAPFDWIFIDADHGYDAVRADWETYSRMGTGILAFHDILPPSWAHPEIQVSQLWRELKAAGHRTRELIDDPNATWGGIGIVFLD